MKLIRYCYTTTDGSHFPDSNLGDNVYYSLDFQCWLEEEEGFSLTNVVWTLPTGVTSEDEYIEGVVAFIKLSAGYRGSFKVIATMASTNGIQTQNKVVPMILKVY